MSKSNTAPRSNRSVKRTNKPARRAKATVAVAETRIDVKTPSGLALKLLELGIPEHPVSLYTRHIIAIIRAVKAVQDRWAEFDILVPAIARDGVAEDKVVGDLDEVMGFLSSRIQLMECDGLVTDAAYLRALADHPEAAAGLRQLAFATVRVS